MMKCSFETAVVDGLFEMLDQDHSGKIDYAERAQRNDSNPVGSGALPAYVYPLTTGLFLAVDGVLRRSARRVEKAITPSLCRLLPTDLLYNSRIEPSPKNLRYL
jgi:hypothetical protein